MNIKKRSKTNLKVRSFLNYWLPSFFWIVVVCFLSLTNSGFPEVKFRLILELDKIVHLALYFVMTLLLIRSWIHTIPTLNTFNLLIFVSIQVIGFSIMLEFLQKLLTTTRNYDIKDIYSNIGGTIFGAIIYLLYQKIFSRKLSENIV